MAHPSHPQLPLVLYGTLKSPLHNSALSAGDNREKGVIVVDIVGGGHSGLGVGGLVLNGIGGLVFIGIGKLLLVGIGGLVLARIGGLDTTWVEGLGNFMKGGLVTVVILGRIPIGTGGLMLD